MYIKLVHKGVFLYAEWTWFEYWSLEIFTSSTLYYKILQIRKNKITQFLCAKKSSWLERSDEKFQTVFFLTDGKAPVTQTTTLYKRSEPKKKNPSWNMVDLKTDRDATRGNHSGRPRTGISCYNGYRYSPKADVWRAEKRQLVFLDRWPAARAFLLKVDRVRAYY